MPKRALSSAGPDGWAIGWGVLATAIAVSMILDWSAATLVLSIAALLVVTR